MVEVVSYVDTDADGIVQRQYLKLPTEPSGQSSNVITIQIRGERGKVTSKRTLNNYGARIVYRTKREDIPVNTDTEFTRVVLEKAALNYLPVIHLD